jgi:integrase
LNPGPPTPQAGILNHSSRQISRILDFNLLLDDDPAYAEYNTKIINTLETMKAKGLKRSTVKSAYKTLRELNRHVDLMNPEAVKLHISNMKNTKVKDQDLNDQSRQKHVNNYDYFVKYNGLKWEKPIYKWDTKTPIAPTKLQADLIIASAPSLNYATIFKILLESGFEGQELHNTALQDIDIEQGKITVAGTKGHSGRCYQFTKPTAEMLKLYVAKHQRTHPFPRPNVMGDIWRRSRKRAYEKTGNKALLNIPLKGLRNLSGFLLWTKIPDPWRVMVHMGHKKLDTTQHYLKGLMLQINEDPEYDVKSARTIEERMTLLEAGYEKKDEIDGIALFRKRK